ncbi:hypothetical protein E2K93_14030 [Thalassotalea sp. HSM 43]|uniref:hypothetical protein n=1 Tax=Thalassotalea sp. HSM 43 TaxID=2552945 RepID=UPI00108110C9|nr:hypothetical protein [Thalassotalea sp. HSM 43]QBY05419.1 hypothetical protein E2K93_14030 [Thalassotalea sp. HSM 43]
MDIHFVLMDAFNELGMRKFVLLLMIMVSYPSQAFALDELTEDSINHIAQQFIDFHRTEDETLLQSVMSNDVQVTVNQGSSGFGFVLQYDRGEYLDYLKKGHRSKTRVGTDVSFISSEFLGNREAKIIIRYRSKKLNKYVWMEGLIELINGEPRVISVDEYN